MVDVEKLGNQAQEKLKELGDKAKGSTSEARPGPGEAQGARLIIERKPGPDAAGGPRKPLAHVRETMYESKIPT